MEQKIFIFYARSYSFEDQATGQKREGISINYLVCNDVTADHPNADGSFGYAPCKDSLPLGTKLGNVPGMYTGEFVLAPSKGSTRLKLNSVSPIAGK